MDSYKPKAKKGDNLIVKTWERCKSFGSGSKPTSRGLKTKSKSWPRLETNSMQEDSIQKKNYKRSSLIAPEGCFSVYVGPQKQRFVIKTKYANHPLFRTLLEEAELEYGYHPDGPLSLPCNVETFYEVLDAINSNEHEDYVMRKGCRFAMNYGGYRLLSPSRMVPLNNQF